MNAEEFANALSLLIADAQRAGLPVEEIEAELQDALNLVRDE